MSMPSMRASRSVFFGLLALPFIGSLAASLAWGQAMMTMAAIPMPGGWLLSMMWTPLCGQGWAGTAATFIGMWTVMMTAMMLPPLAPMLWRYRLAIGRAGSDDGWRPTVLTMLAGVGYLAAWAALGAAVFPVGALLASVALELPTVARLLPVAGGGVVLAAGLSQFSSWKRRQLACCRMVPGCDCGPVGIVAAWRHGLRLGLGCMRCCAGPTAVLLVMGAMDLAVMAAVAAAICLERLAPGGERLARLTGTMAVLTGAAMILRVIQAV